MSITLKSEPGITPKKHRRTAKKVAKQEWPCPYIGCTTILYSKSSQFRHRKLHDVQIAKYSCVQCSEAFVIKLDMMDHTRKKHMPKDSYVECTDCGRTFTSISNLNAHSTIHKEKEDAKYHCGECKIFYFHKSALRRHRKAEHGLDLIECRKLSTSTINSNGSSYYSPCNSADASYLASPPITPKMTNSSCDICSFQSHCIEDYNLHLESAHLLSKDLKCLVNACGTFCGSSKTLHEHQSSCHPFFS